MGIQVFRTKKKYLDIYSENFLILEDRKMVICLINPPEEIYCYPCHVSYENIIYRQDNEIFYPDYIEEIDLLALLTTPYRKWALLYLINKGIYTPKEGVINA